MNTDKAIKLAGGGTRGRAILAELVGVTSLATYRWSPNIPDRHVWKLQVLRPEWFKKEGKK